MCDASGVQLHWRMAKAVSWQGGKDNVCESCQWQLVLAQALGTFISETRLCCALVPNLQRIVATIPVQMEIRLLAHARENI